MSFSLRPISQPPESPFPISFDKVSFDKEIVSLINEVLEESSGSEDSSDDDSSTSSISKTENKESSDEARKNCQSKRKREDSDHVPSIFSDNDIAEFTEKLAAKIPKQCDSSDSRKLLLIKG